MKQRAVISAVLCVGLGVLVVVSDLTKSPVPNSFLGLITGFLLINALAWWSVEERRSECENKRFDYGEEKIKAKNK